MLEITRQADYALRAVRDVAKLSEGERLPTAVIAERQKIPLPFLAKIVSQLAVKGILEATRGASGGVSLARPAGNITLLEVIEAIDGPMTLNRCTRDPNACEFSEECPLYDIFNETQQMLAQRLGSVTFADVIDGRAASG
jgi:Rrf2 family protein